MAFGLGDFAHVVCDNACQDVYVSHFVNRVITEDLFGMEAIFYPMFFSPRTVQGIRRFKRGSGRCQESTAKAQNHFCIEEIILDQTDGFSLLRNCSKALSSLSKLMIISLIRLLFAVASNRP